MIIVKVKPLVLQKFSSEISFTKLLLCSLSNYLGSYLVRGYLTDNFMPLVFRIFFRYLT